MKNIADIRKDYSMLSLNEGDAAANAISQFTTWWDQAIASEIVEVNAMLLSTADGQGKPGARVVLLKGFDEKGFVFYSNYQSHKGMQIAANPQVSLVFFWKELERQVRIEGIASKITPEASDAYFASRPEGSRIGAWASPQSKSITGRQVIEENVSELEKSFAGKEIDRPPHWGGYVVKPLLIEFWQGRSNRLHDRLQYTIKTGSTWTIERLAP